MKYQNIYNDLIDDLARGILPRHLVAALSHWGLKEVPGPLNHPTIMKMAINIGCADIYKADSMPWCALFMSATLAAAGRPIFTKDRYDNLRALSFLKWGAEVEMKDAAIGDILVFKRKGGGHVGNYVGESVTHFFVYGGNQGDAVNIIELPKKDCVGVRRPVYNNMPAGVVKRYYNAAGNGEHKLS